MRKLLLGASLLALGLGWTAQAHADPLKIIFTVHSSASNTFWQSVKKGFDDGCAKIQAQCQIIFTQTEGSIEQQAANMQAAVARKPDALITSIVDNNAFNAIINDARDKGIIVIASNVDHLEGAKGSRRQAFIGQGLYKAGFTLAQTQAANFPKEGPINVLVGVSAPGQNWSEQRAAGIAKGVEEWKTANPGREVTVTRIDSGTDLGIAADRVGAYLNGHPNTTAYFDTGYWDAGVARVLKDRGVAPGKVLLAGFDLVPEVLQQMKTGYVQVQVDQQPYLQGFMPVMEVFLNKTAGLAPFDLDTGQGVVLPKDVDSVMDLARKSYR
jgi:simple sugar transport system substrate-binding protein